MIHLDPRKTWWWEKQTQIRLTTWALALLQGRRYSVHLTEKGSSFILLDERVIQINAQLFQEHSPVEQFYATQGLIAHEVGHAFFTQAWPNGEKETRLREMTNFLEDKRVERAISIYYPGIAETIQKLGDLMVQRITPIHSYPAEQAYVVCLAWRWACGRIPEEQMLERMKCGPNTCALWKKVRPLVELAWEAVDTTRVIQISRQILEVLELNENNPPLQPASIGNDDLLNSNNEPVQAFPEGPCSTIQPGRGKGLEGGETFQTDTVTTPAAYNALEEQALPFANQLAEALRLPARAVSLEPDESSGRYSFRQEMRTPLTPHLVRSVTGLSSQDLALYILVDRSGSMSVVNEEIRLSLMTLYLACMELNIPLGISYFGADQERDQTLLVSQPLSCESEKTKALIAGYEGKTSNEFLAWGLREAEANLSTCQARTRVILVVHDGEPVYHGCLGNDWELSQSGIRHLIKAGYLVIGVYIYPSSQTEHARSGEVKLQKLFPNLVSCSQKQFAQKLGGFLSSLAYHPGL